MDEYKQINKELIKVNQQMKIELGIYRNEIIALRAQLMEEHENRVSREKKLRAMVIQNFQNFKTTIRAIDPDFVFMNMLDDTGGGEGEIEAQDKLATNQQRRNSKGQILQEFRHSNLVQRRSSISFSPNRRSLSPSIGSPVNAADQHADEEVTIVPLHRQVMGCIPESAMETTSASETESEAQVEVEVIEDSVSDFSSPEPPSPSIRVLRGRHVQHRNPLQDLSNLTNSFKKSKEPSPSRAPAYDSNVAVNRGKRRGFVAFASQLNNSDSLEPVRCSAGMQILLNDEPISNKTIQTSLGLSKKLDYSNDLSRSPSPALSKLSIRQFADVPSSTPNNSQTKTYIEEESTTLRSRSQRSCKPQNLKEPSQRKKLRNETATTKAKPKKK